jgi:hypothetical protein
MRDFERFFGPNRLNKALQNKHYSSHETTRASAVKQSKMCWEQGKAVAMTLNKQSSLKTAHSGC